MKYSFLCLVRGGGGSREREREREKTENQKLTLCSLAFSFFFLSHKKLGGSHGLQGRARQRARRGPRGLDRGRGGQRSQRLELLLRGRRRRRRDLEPSPPASARPAPRVFFFFRLYAPVFFFVVSTIVPGGMVQEAPGRRGPLRALGHKRRRRRVCRRAGRGAPGHEVFLGRRFVERRGALFGREEANGDG